MNRKINLWQWMLDSGGLEEECIPGQSVVELLGGNRALIENHRRVIEYDLTQICLRVSFGTLQIFGRNLRLQGMNGRKLLITGEIERIEICRGERI